MVSKSTSPKALVGGGGSPQSTTEQKMERMKISYFVQSNDICITTTSEYRLFRYCLIVVRDCVWAYIISQNS